MTYDQWKTETPEDEADRRRGRVVCEECEERYAVGSYEFGGVWKGVPAAYLCEPCAITREEEAAKPVCNECGELADAWHEDMTGYDPNGGQWLCERCHDKQCEPRDYNDYPDRHDAEATMRLKR